MKDISGDVFDEKYDVYSKLIYRVAYLYLKNAHDAEDAVQEVFIKLLYKAPTFSSMEWEKAWIIRVTSNYCKNILKSSWKKKNMELNEDVLQKNGPNFEFGILYEIMQLEPKYKDAVYLYFVDGYKLREVASILHLSLSTVKMRIKRAKEILKINLEEDGIYDFSGYKERDRELEPR